MAKHANWRGEVVARKYVIIRDMGPWDEHLTVTNDAEYVVEKLVEQGLDDRRLIYFDSEGEPGELLVENGKFAGFAPFDMGRYPNNMK